MPPVSQQEHSRPVQLLCMVAGSKAVEHVREYKAQKNQLEISAEDILVFEKSIGQSNQTKHEFHRENGVCSEVLVENSFYFIFTAGSSGRRGSHSTQHTQLVLSIINQVRGHTEHRQYIGSPPTSLNTHVSSSPTLRASVPGAVRLVSFVSMSSPRTRSATPPPKDTRVEEGAETSRAVAVATTPFSTSSHKASHKEQALVAWSPTAAATADVPMDTSIPPPTIEELDAMDMEEGCQEAEICETPSASDISANSKRPPAFSRQVVRVSGTGRATLQHTSKGVVVPGRKAAARKAGPSPRGRLKNQAPSAALMIEQGARTQARSNLSRRSISADDMDRRLMSRVHRHDGVQRGPNDIIARRAANNAGGQLARQRAPPAEGPTSTQGSQKSNGNARNTRPRAGQRDARGTAARRVPYAAQGTPSAWKDNNNSNNNPKRPERKQPVITPFADVNGGGHGGAAASAGDIVPSKLRRRNSAPSMSEVGQEFEFTERVEPSQVESGRGSETCWGGGLPPARNAIAQGPSGARAMAARAPPTTERFPDRYPANDRESFARTLNDEELDEVWQGLGEGVSQRGCGSEVAFECPAPSSPGTAVGAFPMLTANVLERHDQLAVSGGGVRPAERPPNVMPIPKDIGDKAVHDMENGTPSSKKSSGSSSTEEASLLATVVLYGMLVLWMAHLVFNALLL